MSIASVHPEYSERKDDWKVMRDTYKGEAVVKDARETYLPATKSMKLDGMKRGELGLDAYEAYLLRAVFPEYTKEAVEAYVGLLHQKPATIELPESMEFLRDKATVNGESLIALLRRINEEQLVTGRLGLLLDLPRTPTLASPLPYIAMYAAESVRNWDAAELEQGESVLNLVVLDESGSKRTGAFDWTAITRFRVLQLGTLAENEEPGKSRYLNGVFEVDGVNGEPVYVESDMKEPILRGVTLEQIPFVFVNSKDNVPSPDVSPLISLARLCLAIYRGEADYRQNLFMQGQDTFVTIGDMKKSSSDLNALSSEGEGDALRTGAGSHVALDAGGDAKYVGVNSTGLSEQREALKNDRQRAETRSGQLIQASGDAESGEALKTRVAAQTATLNQIAISGAAGLERMLKICAEWMGADPTKVKVQPNLEFADFEMTGKNLIDLMTARSMGAPLAKRSIHALMVDQGLTKMDYETEIETLTQEQEDDVASGLVVLPGDKLALEREKIGAKDPAAEQQQKEEQTA